MAYGQPYVVAPTYSNNRGATTQGQSHRGQPRRGNHIEGNHAGLPLLFVYFNNYTDQCGTFFNIGFKSNRIVAGFKGGGAHALVAQGCF